VGRLARRQQSREEQPVLDDIDDELGLKVGHG
jgi:hypothetical protein